MTRKNLLSTKEKVDGIPLLHVKDMKKYYNNEGGLLSNIYNKTNIKYLKRFADTQEPIKAVDGVSFDVKEGETLGIVGESGCGKSTLGKTILGLHEPTEGEIRYRGKPVKNMDKKEVRSFRKNAQIVFQEPLSSLNPRMTVESIIREPLDVHSIGDKEERVNRVDELLEEVGISTENKDRYPHEFSGGQCQRIAIARALALNPDLIVLDEPVSALDVNVQAQILNTLVELQDRYNLTYVFIGHDLSVIEYICDRVAVMYLGNIIELGSKRDVFNEPQHPYTEALHSNVSKADPQEKERDVNVLRHDVPSPQDPPSGCRFRTRCPKIIQSDRYSINQTDWRRLMDFKHDVEKTAIDPESILGVELRKRNENNGDEIKELDDQYRIELLKSYFELPIGIGGNLENIIEESINHINNNNIQKAQAVLSENLDTICEEKRPELISISQDHQAACHLHSDN